MRDTMKIKNFQAFNFHRKLDKKGAEMTIGTIVMIILALVVLVVIIYGFTTGWSNLWQNIIGFGGGKVNVQTVVSSCQLACSTNGVYDYCTKERNVVETEDSKGVSMKCFELEGSRYGLDACEQIDCSSGTSSVATGADADNAGEVGGPS